MTPGSRPDALKTELSALAAAGLRRALREAASPAGIETEIDGRRLVNFGSNNYLSLAGHPEVVAAATEALQRYGASPASSRLVAGNHPLYSRLEADISAMKGSGSALVYSSGYLANIGTIPALVSGGDGVACDRLSHASLLDACRISGARLLVFPHNDAGKLADIMRERRKRYRRMLIVTEGLFSMDGDLGALGELAAVADEFDSWLYVDDAHGTGVLGRTGCGSMEEQGIAGGDKVIQMGTLSKALGSTGGFVAASPDMRELLVNRARSLIFETGLPASAAAAAIAAISLVRREAWRFERVRQSGIHLRKRLMEMGFSVRGEYSPIVPVIAGKNELGMEWMEKLRLQGLFVPAIRPPAVPEGGARLRISLQAAHSEEHIERLLAAFDSLPREGRG